MMTHMQSGFSLSIHQKMSITMRVLSLDFDGLWNALQGRGARAGDLQGAALAVVEVPLLQLLVTPGTWPMLRQCRLRWACMMATLQQVMHGLLPCDGILLCMCWCSVLLCACTHCC
jgi:hypothetical protein